MTPSDDPKRILLVGRDAGPVAKILKINSKNIEIGIVDVLGNLETRKYSDWSFSVERQIPNSSINRRKQRSLMGLIEELTLIMMEEHDFDLFIPLSSLHEVPDFISKISKKINSKPLDKEIFEITSSNSALLSGISRIQSDINRRSDFILPNLAQIEFEQERMVTRSINKIEESITEPKPRTFRQLFLPQEPVYCIALIRIEKQFDLIGIQKVIPPVNKHFFVDDYSKNGLVPVNEIPGVANVTSLMEVFRNLVIHLNLSGIITFYFSIKNSTLIPYQCNLLPDENFDLWNYQAHNVIWKYFLNEDFSVKSYLKHKRYSFKIPVYSPKPITVPEIECSIATQRNIPKAISSSEYPICSIYGHQSTIETAIRDLNVFKRTILNLLGLVDS